MRNPALNLVERGGSTTEFSVIPSADEIVNAPNQCGMPVSVFEAKSTADMSLREAMHRYPCSVWIWFGRVLRAVPIVGWTGAADLDFRWAILEPILWHMPLCPSGGLRGCAVCREERRFADAQYAMIADWLTDQHKKGIRVGGEFEAMFIRKNAHKFFGGR